jgi:bifunctional non-homologous end joining protein LigD
MAQKSIAPMLATLGTADDLVLRDDAGDWAYEMKWDGIRAIVEVRSGRVSVTTRNGIDVTVTYPELSELPDLVDQDVVLDGEIVALGRRGQPDFGLLQKRMKLTRGAEVDLQAKATPVYFMVFDILSAGGRLVTSREYDDRRSLLESVVHSSGHIQVPPAFHGDLDAALASSRELSLEGIVAKRRDSTYAAGKRSNAWIKIKHHKTQEVVIGGWREGRGSRVGGIGSLLMGIPTGSGLRYVGRVGTGFGDRELRELTRQLSGMERATSPFDDVPGADARDAHWVTPKLVGEVEFAEWTSADRLRQPSWRGWRTDKSADSVVREA